MNRILTQLGFRQQPLKDEVRTAVDTLQRDILQRELAAIDNRFKLEAQNAKLRLLETWLETH